MKIKLFYIIALPFFFAGCSKVMYVPNSINVPLFKEKNEFRSTISFTDYQFAYAVSKNIGLMVNGYIKNTDYSTTDIINSGYSTTSSTYTTSRNLIEGGIGYFSPLDEGFIFEAYGGGGMGSLAYNYYDDNSNPNPTSNKYSTNFSRLFIQPSIGYTNDLVDVAFSARIVQLGFNTIKTENYSDVMLKDEQIYNLDKTRYYFIEPAITLRLGYKWAKIQLQALYSNKINAEPLNYQKFSFNVGIHINLSPRFKNSKGIVTELNK